MKQMNEFNDAKYNARVAQKEAASYTIHVKWQTYRQAHTRIHRHDDAQIHIRSAHMVFVVSVLSSSSLMLLYYTFFFLLKSQRRVFIG